MTSSASSSGSGSPSPSPSPSTCKKGCCSASSALMRRVGSKSIHRARNSMASFSSGGQDVGRAVLAAITPTRAPEHDLLE